MSCPSRKELHRVKSGGSILHTDPKNRAYLFVPGPEQWEEGRGSLEHEHGPSPIEGRNRNN